MNAIEINSKAMRALEAQEFGVAQALFFENARINPSLETYNNLGYYLITEGYVSKNGNIRNSYSLGMKYLEQASEMKKTQINLSAIVTALEMKTATASRRKCAEICVRSRDLLEESLKMGYSNITKYNLLKFEYMLNPRNQSVLNEIRTLIGDFECEECAQFYFNLLRIHSLKAESIDCIGKYEKMLTSSDILLFYASIGMYEEGYRLCDRVTKEFYIDKHLLSAIIECLIAVGKKEEIMSYAEIMKERSFDTPKEFSKKIFENLSSSSSYRRNLIKNADFMPAYYTPCCYFWCERHNNL